MNFRSVLAGLALAGVVSSGLFAQDAPAPGGGGQRRGGMGGMGFQMTKWSDFKFATAPADSNTAVLDQATYEAAALAKLPADATDETKATAKTRIDARFIAIAKAAGVADPTADTKLSEFQYYKGIVNSMGQGMGGRGRGGAGGGGNRNRGGNGGNGGGALRRRAPDSCLHSILEAD